MNNIIKISVVVTLALVVALFAGCGKKKTDDPKNESSMFAGGDIADILGEDNEVTSDIGKAELLPDTDEDTVDAGALDKFESSNANSSDNSSKDNNSKNESSSSSKNESSSSKNEGSSSKNETSSKNEGSSSKNPSSSQASSSSTESMEKDTDSKTYTPGWI